LLNTVLGSLSSGVAASTSSYESIATATGTGSSGTITFSSIPATYASLQIRCIANDGDNGQIIMRFNSDTGANYARHNLRGTGSIADAGGTANTTSITNMGWAAGTTNVMGAAIIDIHDYASTTKTKVARAITAYDANGTGAIYLASGLYNSTTAINSITFFVGGNFNTQTVFALYGIKG
jgi:hypothetical protein